MSNVVSIFKLHLHKDAIRLWFLPVMNSVNPHVVHKKYTGRVWSHLDGVISKSADDLFIVILEAVNTFAVLRPTLDPLQVMSATPPVRLDGLGAGTASNSNNYFTRINQNDYALTLTKNVDRFNITFINVVFK